MKVTFPHMGFLHIPLKSLLEDLGREVIVPGPVSQKTLALGIKYAPEFACLPLKIGLGNFIEALDKGANTIVMAGGWGPCRFGYYAQVQRDILKDLGYDFQMVILEAPDSKLTELVNQLKSIGENVSFFEAVRALRFAWYKLAALEKVEESYLYFLPRVLDKNQSQELYKQSFLNIEKAKDRLAVDEAVAVASHGFEGLLRHSNPVLRIGLVGEIYTVLEPFSNQFIASALGRLDVEVTNSIRLTAWINEHLFKGHLFKSAQKHYVDCARPYLAHSVGGHGLETVGTTVDFARCGYDGVIQVGPLTCMPEIVAQTVLTRVSREEQIPCMTLYFDEHSGNAGTQTRLEAFVDMLRRRGRNRVESIKESQEGVANALLSRC